MTQIADSPYGSLRYENGELCNDAKVTDPTAFRVGSKSGGLGKWSGDRIRADGVREELVLDQFKEDERYPGSLAGEVTRHLRRPHADGDAAMVPIYTMRHDGITFHVPVNLPPPSYMQSVDGRYQIHIQGDGNFVVYDVKPAGWKALWSWMTGKLP